MSGARLASLLVAIGSLGGSPSAAQQPDRVRGDTPVARAQRTTGTIHVDGRLDEPDWAQAPALDPLTQREPFEGREATEPTDVRILFDERALYIGIVCHESHPDGLVSTQLTRDANLDVDDRDSRVSLYSTIPHLWSDSFSSTPTPCCSRWRRCCRS